MIRALYTVAEVIINSNQVENLPKNNLGSSTLQNVTNILLGIIAGISLLIITIAGFKYVMSQGNPDEVAKAKNTIIYALVGLILSLFAFAITAFIFARLK
jgi:ABC-type maltose transport system permease subunit